MTAHVFIVGDNTFPMHLRYQFAGIGAVKRVTKPSRRARTPAIIAEEEYVHIDFNGASDSQLHSKAEFNLTGMMADMLRIRRGDSVFFYVQNQGNNEGRFYGKFRVREDAPFLDNGGEKQFLLAELGKSLTFRVLIEPDEVYPAGVSEWQALDEIRHLARPHQMLWSLIYRKLKGNRGCTMITHYEEEYLHGLIQNGQQRISAKNRALNFDANTRDIVAEDYAPPEYRGEKIPFSISRRMMAKEKKKQQIEIYLQADITRRIGREGDSLTEILMGGERPFWIGNEVKCGVGMQSIDVMLCRSGGQQRLTLIELKSVPANPDNIRQLRRYVEWTEQYYLPNSPAIIEPVLIARKTPGDLPEDFLRAAAEFNRDNRGRTCEPLRIVEFVIDGEEIRYQERQPDSD